MQEYKITLKQKEEIAENTWMFYFEKPKDFIFEAGQYVFLEILQNRFKDERPNLRAFSIASAPYENDLVFIMRKSTSAFKHNIISMELGEEIKLKGPIGHFTLNKNIKKEIVFLVAGVGITPVRSILRQESFLNSSRKMTLFYSNRNIKSAALYNDMENLPSLNNYQCINMMTQDCSGWSGECRRINADVLNKYLDDVKNPVYYIVGLKVFIDAMKSMLISLGVEEKDIVFDNFG